MQAPHLLCALSAVAMTSSSGASSCGPLLGFHSAPRPQPQAEGPASADLSHQLHPQLGWAPGQGEAGFLGVGGHEWLL